MSVSQSVPLSFSFNKHLLYFKIFLWEVRIYVFCEKVAYKDRAEVLKSELETLSDISGDGFQDVKLFYALATQYLEKR